MRVQLPSERVKSNHAIICIDCYKKEKSKDIPSKDELKQSLQEHKNFCKIARIYGVSDNAVRKWCKKYHLPYKTSDLKVDV